MNTYHKIAVLGGGGRTGKFVVEKLLSEGFSVKVLLRNTTQFLADFANDLERIEIVEGDAIDEKSIVELLSGSDAVLSTIGQRKDEPLVCGKATEYILDNMKSLDIKRYILVSGFNIDSPDDEKSQETQDASLWMKTNFPEASADKQRVYQLLSESDVNWTMVRLPMIEYHSFPGRIKVSLADVPGDKIGAGDIAAFMVGLFFDVDWSHCLRISYRK